MSSVSCNNKKTSIHQMEPIRRAEDISAISAALAGSPRDQLLFIMGVNTWLYVSDLLTLKIRDVYHLNPGDKVTLCTGRSPVCSVLQINHITHDYIRRYLHRLSAREGLSGDSWLFPSRKGGPLLPATVNNMIKKWTKSVGLKGNYGCHSLRKTWGYHHWLSPHGYAATVREMLNQRTANSAMKYLHLTPAAAASPEVEYLELGGMPGLYTAAKALAGGSMDFAHSRI